MWLRQHAKFPLSSGLVQKIKTEMKRFGLIRFEKDSKETFLLMLLLPEEKIIRRIKQLSEIMKCILQKNKNTLVIPMEYRGLLKKKCVDWGYPPLDAIGSSGRSTAFPALENPPFFSRIASIPTTSGGCFLPSGAKLADKRGDPVAVRLGKNRGGPWHYGKDSKRDADSDPECHLLPTMDPRIERENRLAGRMDRRVLHL